MDGLWTTLLGCSLPTNPPTSAATAAALILGDSVQAAMTWGFQIVRISSHILQQIVRSNSS